MKYPVFSCLFFWLAPALLLTWALHKLPLAELWISLSQLNPGSILTLIAINILIMAMFASRWWFLLRALGYYLPFLPLVGYRLAAFALSYLSPGTQFGGEPLQVYMLQKRHHLPTPAAIAAVTVDKLFELIANFTFLALGVILTLSGGLLGTLARWPVVIFSTTILSLPLVYLLALWKGHYPLTWLSNHLSPPLASSRLVHRFLPMVLPTEKQISGLCRQKPATMAWVLLLSGLTWVVMVCEYWLTLSFLGAQLSPLQAISALTSARLAFLTPLPGGAGALEASQVLALEALGFHPALGISLSVLIRARDLTFGLVGLWLAGAFAWRGAPVSRQPGPGDPVASVEP